MKIRTKLFKLFFPAIYERLTYLGYAYRFEWESNCTGMERSAFIATRELAIELLNLIEKKNETNSHH